MCEPITGTALTVSSAAGYAAAAAAAIGAATSLVSADSAKKNSEASAEQQRLAIADAAAKANEQSNRQGIEDRENQAQTQQQLTRERAMRIAAARTSAAAGGISGASVDALMLDLAGKGLEASTTSETNYARQQAARQDAIDNAGTNRRSQLNSIRTSAGPGALDYLGAGLNVGNAYMQTNQRSQQRIGK